MDSKNRRPSQKRTSKPYKNTERTKTQDELIRLNRYLSNAGVCSRREADLLISQGKVWVNGIQVTEVGTKVKREDKVECKGKILVPEKLVYILMNKPKNMVTTVKDPHAGRTVIDLLEGACPQRIYPVGRLDRNTTGVLLLTNDGELTDKLIHPSYNKKKIYQLSLDKAVTKADMEKLVQGFDLEDGFIRADKIDYIAEDKKQLGIEIHSGQNHIIRRMFEHMGYRVTKLDRVYFAGLTKKGIKRGSWRFLTDSEISMLKRGAYS